MRKLYDNQLSKRIAQLPSSSPRAEPLLRLPLATQPTDGFICCSTNYSALGPHQHASVATANLRWLTSHLTAQPCNLIESTQQQLQILAPRSKWVG